MNADLKAAPLCVDEYEAAEMLRVAIATFRREVAAGSIPKTKIRGATRFDIDDLKAYVKRCKLVPEMVGAEG